MNRNNDIAPQASDEGWTLPVDPADPRLGRRTVLAGAAWSLPVIAAAVATPLAAASAATPTLEFVSGPYTATACGTLDDVVIRATTDGTAPNAGALVTVTLPAGLSWPDGTSTPRVLPTNASGEVTLSGLVASEANGTHAITASNGALSTSAPVTVVPSGAGSGLLDSNGDLITTFPGGRSVVDMTTAVHPTTGETRAMIVADDGTTWSYNVTTDTWTRITTAPASILISTDAAMTIVLSDGPTLFSATGNSVTPLPGGRTAVDISSSNHPTSGNILVEVVASDGTAWQYNWTTKVWIQHPSPSATLVSSDGGTAVVLSDGTRLFSATGNNPSTPIPGGRVAADMSVAVVGSQVLVDVVATDGTAWQFNWTTRVWTQKTAVAEAALVGSDRSQVLYAGVARC